MKDLTADQLRAELIYNADTGDFFRRETGELAGCIDVTKGYRRIFVRGCQYQAHRLAWLYVYGAWPDRHTDHINGIRHDNRICNLREATPAENAQNRKIHANNRSGFMGVGFHKSTGYWRAAISAFGVKRVLGYFKDPLTAHAAYLRAKEELHQFSPYIRQASQSTQQAT